MNSDVSETFKKPFSMTKLKLNKIYKDMRTKKKNSFRVISENG